MTDIETLRADKSELEAALESLKAHMGNAVMNRDGIIKVLEKTRDEQGDEIHRLREDVASWKAQAMHNLDLIERLAEALREAYEQVRELCDCYGHVYPEASFIRYEALLRDQEVGNE